MDCSRARRSKRPWTSRSHCGSVRGRRDRFGYCPTCSYTRRMRWTLRNFQLTPREITVLTRALRLALSFVSTILQAARGRSVYGHVLQGPDSASSSDSDVYQRGGDGV